MPAPSRSAHPAVVVGTGFGCRVHVPALRAAGFDVLIILVIDKGGVPDRLGRAAETPHPGAGPPTPTGEDTTWGVRMDGIGEVLLALVVTVCR